MSTWLSEMKVEISALWRGSLTDIALNRATWRVAARIELGRGDRVMEISLLKSGPVQWSVTQRSKSGGGMATGSAVWWENTWILCCFLQPPLWVRFLGRLTPMPQLRMFWTREGSRFGDGQMNKMSSQEWVNLAPLIWHSTVVTCCWRHGLNGG